MITKILKWTGIVIGSLFALIIITSIVVMIIVDKEMVEGAMQDALHRQVRIEEVRVGIFSAVSGIEVSNVQISNYKSEKELKKLAGKPVARRDLFVGLKAFIFKFSFMPLFAGKVVLNELMLYEPEIHVVRYKSGAFNFSDLIQPKKMTAEERAALKKKEAEEARKAREEAKKGPGKAFTADDLPVEITVGKVGIEKGLLTFYDEGARQRFSVYNLTAKVYDIAIDPQDLKGNNRVKVAFSMGIKTVGQTPKNSSVKSFDIGIQADGTVIPFDVKSRQVNPEITLKVGSPYGSMTGLQLFESLKSVEALESYTGKFDFLSKTMKWKDAYVHVWYKNGVVDLKEGTIDAKDYKITYAGTVNTNNKNIEFTTDVVLSEKHTAKIKQGIKKNVTKLIKGKMAKYVDADKVTDAAIKPMLNPDARVFLVYHITGTMQQPKTTLVKPKLGSLSNVIKEAGGDIADQLKDEAKKAAKERATKEVEKRTEKTKKKATEKAKSKLKKLF